MLTIDILTLFPDFFNTPLQYSIIKKAIEKNKFCVRLTNIRDFSTSKHKQVDDYAYGGEAGMVMMPNPLAKAIKTLSSKNTYDEIIYLTPDGKPLEQQTINNLSLKKNLLLLCGHYKGIDERIRKKYISKEFSIGDYVLSGGETAALVFIDAICRLLPNVLNNETSALTDSFQNKLLSHPIYTRPKTFEGMSVPKVLLSGNHKEIEKWKNEQALQKTKIRRPDLLS